MNLRDLRYLTAVAEHSHFGKAAEACFVSQPTLSMQLKKLEEYLGVVLFERDNKHVMITPAGRAIVERAKRVLNEADGIIDYARSIKNPMSGQFRLGAFPTLAPYLLPRIMPALSEALPDITWYLVEEKTAMLLEKLKEGALDAALVAMPVQDMALECAELFDDHFMLAVSSKHPFADRKRVTLEEAKGQNLLLLEEGHCLREQALEVCSRIGASEAGDFRATSLETLRQMVAANVGVTLMPELAIPSNGVDKNAAIRYIPFASPPSRSIGLFWRKTSPRTPVLERMVALIKESMDV